MSTDYLHQKLDFANPELVAVYDEVFLWSARFGELLFKHLPLRRSARVLDLACGTGFPLFELAHRLGRSCELVGVDVWKEALERARRKLKVYGLSNVQLVEADGAALPFPDSSFDLIVSNLGVNNFANPQAALAECFRVLKAGGTLALTTNLQGHMHEFYKVFREVLTELHKTGYLARLQAQEAHRGTKASVSQLLQEAGFTIAKTGEDSFQMRYLDGSAFFNHWLTKLGFLEGWRGVLAPADEEAVFGLLEARLNGLAEARGELRMTIPMLYLEGQK
jgi:ubiquinone/menaquinone biosynthesis C-methylase UbiE